MDSYVVRIYRRDERNPGKVAGLVELIEQEQIKSFMCIEELVKILGLKGGERQGTDRRGVSRFNNQISKLRKKP